MKRKNILKGAVVLLITVAMVFSTVAIAENTKKTSFSSKIGQEVQCNASIDIEKYVWDEKNDEWVDADTENEALDIPICHDATFKIVVLNDGDCPLADTIVEDILHDTLVFKSADPEPDTFQHVPPYYYMSWGYAGLNIGETIEINITAHVKGPDCTIDSNYAFVISHCIHCCFIEDEDWCWVHAKTGGRTLNRPFLHFLQNHPNLLKLIQLLLQRLGL
jgi:hypothetical protein